jgi:hypothetical protein
MKRNIVWILFLFAMLSLSLAAAAKDNAKIAGCTCSADMIEGAWGYSETGMQIFFNPTEHYPAQNITAPPLELRPYASVGSYTIDAQGNVSGQRTNAQSTGPHQTCIISGTATVNPDCTGTYSVLFSEPPNSTNVIPCSGSVTKLVVYVNNATEASMLIPFDPITLSPNLKASGVLTTEAKKLFPDSDNPGLHLGNCRR